MQYTTYNAQNNCQKGCQPLCPKYAVGGGYGAPERNAPSFLRGHNLHKNPPILYTDKSSAVIN